MRLPLLICATFQILIVSATSPYVVEWNTTHSYGADGPWPVVTIRVGKDGDGGALSWMDLHPGGIRESMLPTKAFCDSSGSPNPCLAEKAALYNVNASSAMLRNFSDEPARVWQWGSESAFNMSGQANNVLDHMAIQTVQGRVDVDNATLAAVDRSQITLPDGTNYSIQVGSLSLGCPIDGIQSFETGVRGETVPGTLRSENIIASNSFGLHYGSVSLGQVGSLIWGGYDQSRVLGNVGSFDLNNDNRMVSSLQDIQIGVEEGSSPFSAGSFKGLLKLDPTFSGVRPTFINPVVPYLFMSPETCSAITENLPVTFQPDIGLYIWNTADPQYQNIVKSPAYLAFIFQDTGVGNITIKVPFRLLNLTLEAPIVSSPQQYFPCRPFSAADGSYFLGRAFLQAAYVGINWEIKKWFLGQAPGPGVGASSIQGLNPNDSTVSSGDITEFAATWEKSWTVLSATNNSTANQGNSSTAESPARHPSGLSRGAKVGIGLGATVGSLGIAGAIVLVYFTNWKNKALQKNRNERDVQTKNLVHEKDATLYREVGQGASHEIPADNGIHEL